MIRAERTLVGRAEGMCAVLVAFLTLNLAMAHNNASFEALKGHKMMHNKE